MREAVLATVDGNEAAASVAYRASEVIAIYPITPASAMGELADEWAAAGRKNIRGTVPLIQEMQSEGGAAGVVHGAAQAGALATTFTASQGLLLMVPNLFKLAGELTPFVLHVAARTIATHALSIFGDHSDVMACRSTGLAMLASSSVQEAHDFALIAHAATLESRVPFLHFFDGFRTSHELNRIRLLDDDDLHALLDEARVVEHRQRALSPDHPVIRGTAQNPDTFFQAREAGNPFYAACPGIVEAKLARLAERTGRRYGLFDYYGHPEAERVIVVMGSAAETSRATVEHLAARDEKVGVVVVRLYRPFSAEHFLRALPSSARRIAILDRTKEPGAIGEPLFLDVLAALAERSGAPMPLVIGGRYGLSSKELTPGMLAGVLAELARPAPKRRFTVGIVDDVTHTSLPLVPELDVFPPGVFQAMFYGLGSDGTVGANKNTIKIVGEQTSHSVQGYFVYDSKKSGAATISHLRFGERPLHAPYLIQQADFVACHQFDLLDRFDMLDRAKPGATFLLNSPYGPSEVLAHIPSEVSQQIAEKALRFFVIDAAKVARDAGLGNRINMVMQTCFWALTDLLPRDQALSESKKMIAKSYEKKGADVVLRNQAAIEGTLAHLYRVEPQAKISGAQPRPPPVPKEAPDFVQRVTAMMIAGRGDQLPVSAFPPDGTWPVGTTQWEKRSLAAEIPVWDPELCIQCNKCVLDCPHAAIRAKVYPKDALEAAPAGFLSTDWRGADFAGQKYTIHVAPDDCTGCQICAVVCPAKSKANPRQKALMMEPQRPRRERERERYSFFLDLPEVDRQKVKLDVKGSQLLKPLFEYSGACAGCGETPYLKLLTQLYGDRLLIANATGCSSIYGANLPTTPYTTDASGRGPAWSNSLFEDNAEFGLGFRLAVDARQAEAALWLRALAPELGEALVSEILEADQRSESGVVAQRARLGALRERLAQIPRPEAARLAKVANDLVRKSVWLVGGDGWAYDIGFGGLDHVLASGADVNILVLDTGVYSNTGGQQSKATPLGAAAKFATQGKELPKKDLGLIAMSYGHVYVAQVAFGAKDAQTVKAFQEAEAHRGPSLIIAYSHCIAHGYDLAHGPDQQRLAVEAGVWPLYRVDPSREARGEPSLHLDAGATPVRSVKDWAMNEARFRMVERIDPKRFAALQLEAQRDAVRRTEIYRQLAELRAKPTDK
ncbi:MAG: pyruvate:ferredoxin (flavodoxin) oxidoreductase [Deltaproteobacteria bacterium]|nr:pyruvate:ferredoxin (flavodoxin) oxidoreductase [Deltaproteobacteria bacterium]